jgi:hypothetical protein
MPYAGSKYICSKCKGSVYGIPSTVWNTSNCCDARIILRPSIREMKQIEKARKDLKLFDKGLNIKSSEFSRIE